MKTVHPRISTLWVPAASLLLCFLVARVAAGQPQTQVAVSGDTNLEKHAYSLAIDAGDYVYVSAQGPRRRDGSLPENFAAQAQQALENVKSLVESSGLTVEHVVYTQVYLEDVGKY